MKIVLSLFLLSLCVSVFGQDDKKMEFFPEMSRGAGVSFQKFDGLNSRIANFPQYKQIRDATGVLQLGWFKENHQFISQMTLMAGSSMSGDRDAKSSTIRYLGAGADIGYDFIKSDKVALYPLVGIGYQAYQARFYTDNSGVDFNTVLSSTAVQNSIKSLDLTNGFFNYRLGAGLAATSAKRHASIGIQALYTGSFKDRAWRSSQDQTLSNAPVDKLSQVYVGLVVTCRPFFMMKHSRM
ncbi:MAG: hypothetical protein ABJB86_06750 [Bacteroidota bacterium]